MVAFLILSFSINAYSKVYLNQKEFVHLVNKETKQPALKKSWENKTLWLNKEIQKEIKDVIDHQYSKLRLRYKIKAHQQFPKETVTIWFLEEIGKERPISFGIAVKDNQILLINVLEFRESRGYEISIPEFSIQFNNAGLDKNNDLNKNINGITGATMSVNAMKKVSRLAITLHNIVLKN